MSTFLRVLKFLEIKEGWPNFLEERILQNVLIIWSLLLYFNFKSFTEPNSSSLIRFQCLVADSGVLFSESLNFYKLKRLDLISGGNQFCRMSEIFGPSSVFQFWKFYDAKFFIINYIWMHYTWFRSTFLRALKFLQIKEAGPNFQGEPILQNVWIIL